MQKILVLNKGESMSNKVYLGPYLKVDKIDWQIPTKTKMNTCSNEQCQEHGKILLSKFCPGCGSEVVKVSLWREADAKDIISETGVCEDFFSVVALGGDKGFAMGYNLRTHYCDSYYGDYERGIDPEAIEKELEAFRLKEEVARVSEHLRERGVGCGLKWGVIVYSG